MFNVNWCVSWNYIGNTSCSDCKKEIRVYGVIIYYPTSSADDWIAGKKLREICIRCSQFVHYTDGADNSFSIIITNR